jgi:ribose 5-phosphate isomerase A
MKEIVARELASRIRDGEIIGVGTGTTVDAALQEIGKRIKNENLRVQVVPTSLESSWRCHEIGLSTLYPGYRGKLSWGFDGADEVDGNLWLIKGKGGALLKEKILAARCERFVVIVDDSKLVRKLGERCPIPVEVVPEALWVVEQELQRFGALEAKLRPATGKHGPIITEAGNLIIDARFAEITPELALAIKSVVGVVEHGVFMDLADEVIVGSAAGIRSIFPS